MSQGITTLSPHRHSGLDPLSPKREDMSFRVGDS